MQGITTDVDTDAATRAYLFQRYREMSREERLARALGLSGLVLGLIRQRLRDCHPTLDPQQRADRFLRQVYGPELADWARSRLGPATSR